MSIWDWMNRNRAPSNPVVIGPDETFWQNDTHAGPPAPAPATAPVGPPQPPPAPTPQPTPARPVAGRLQGRIHTSIRRALPSLSEQWVNALGNSMEQFDIDDVKQPPAFIGQILAESGSFKPVRESLNYSVSGLMATFGRHRISSADVKRLGRKPNAPPLSAVQQAMIANIVYGGEYGRKNLGNMEPNDGWEWRGGGMTQLTGRHNWTRWAMSYGVPLENAADAIMTIEGAAHSAAWFWKNNGCGAIANRLPENAPEESQAFIDLTIKINGGTNGLAHRKEAYRKIRQAFAQAA